MPREEFWTAERDAELLRMRNVDKMNWIDIGAVIGRSKTATQARYSKLTPDGQRIKFERRRRGYWSAETVIILKRLRFEEGRKIPEIAALMRKTVSAVQTKLSRMETPSRRVHFEKTTSAFRVPLSAIADRDHRYNLEPRDLTAALQGDPLPGFSALERRI